MPAAKPEDYTIHYGQDTPEVKQFDQSARTWLHTAEFPRELGSTVAKTIDEITRVTAAMNEDQLVEFGQREYVKLQHLYGDQLGAKLRAAGQMVEALETKQPGIKQLLRSRGIGDASRIVTLILDQSERWHARRKGR